VFLGSCPYTPAISHYLWGIMETLPFREWHIAYTQQGRGETILFLHNGGTSHHIWTEVAAQLQDQYHTVSIDLLGYGESSKPGHSYTMDVYVDMVRTVLDTLGVERVYLVGNCMGSAISLHFAKEYTARVRALVLINPLTEATFSKGWLAGVLKARQLSPKLVGGAYRKLSALRLPGWTASSSLAFQLGRRGRKENIHHDEKLQRLHTSDGQLRSMLEVLADIDAYAAVDAPGFTDGLPPILTIWGEANRILSAKAGHQLNQTLAPRESCTISDCGHLVMMEAPNEVATHIREFLHSFETTEETAHAI